MNKTAKLKKIEYVYIKWGNRESVTAGEKKKELLENKGYSCIDTVGSPLSSMLTYKKE